MPAKKVEIDEGDLATLQNAYKLLQTMNGNPEARRNLEKGMKVINPQLETEDDIAARIAAPHVERISKLEADLAATQKSIADREAAAAAAAEDARTNSALGWLDTQSYTDEGKAEIKKIMVDEKVANVEAAAALFEKRKPKPVVIPGANYESDSWNLRGDPDDKNLEALFKNEDAWADREAALTLNAIRQQGANAQAA